MKTLTGIMIVVYGVAIAIGLAHLFGGADSISDATQSLMRRLYDSVTQLHAWAYADGFAFCAGLIEGFLWQRQQVFAGFYRTIFYLSIPVATAMILTAALLPVVESLRGVWLVGLFALSFALGLTLLAGRPLVR
jgi:hypothetical protein